MNCVPVALMAVAPPMAALISDALTTVSLLSLFQAVTIRLGVKLGASVWEFGSWCLVLVKQDFFFLKRALALSLQLEGRMAVVIFKRSLSV